MILEGLMAASEPEQFLEHHFPYEAAMLQGTHQVLEIKTIEMNSLIESFAIHARSFLEFFEVKKKKGYCASDFTRGPYHPSFVSTLNPDTIKKLDTQIAHMTAARTANQDEKLGGKERAQLLGAITKELAVFREHLRPPFDGSTSQKK